MKLTIEDFSGPDQFKRELCYHAEIYLDGKPVTGCTSADEEAGEVVLAIAQDDPRWQTEFKECDHWPSETFRGKVEIRDSRISPVYVSDDMIGAVEDAVGFGSGAWGDVHPRQLIAAIIRSTPYLAAAKEGEAQHRKLHAAFREKSDSLRSVTYALHARGYVPVMRDEPLTAGGNLLSRYTCELRSMKKGDEKEAWERCAREIEELLKIPGDDGYGFDDISITSLREAIKALRRIA